MANISDGENEITEINVTPFVDIMLVLLVIFMVTATYIANQAIQVKLPKAATGENAGAQNLAFVLDADSQLYVDGEPLLFDQLGDFIQGKLLDGDPQLQALITADEKTPHGDVVKLIDIVRKNGISDFAINIEVE
jgi:biopolymer transport protein TolR